MSDIFVANFEEDSRLGGGGFIHNWEPAWGSELIWKYLVPRLPNGARVLDLCSGFGRASMPLGVINHAQITYFDRDLDCMEAALMHANNFELTVTSIIADIGELSNVLAKTPQFDAILVMEGLTHQYKSTATKTINSLVRFLAPHGLLYLDAPTTEDYYFQHFSDCDYPQPEKDTFMDMCSCNGPLKLEPFSFFWPGELSLHLLNQGLNIIYQNSDYLDGNVHKTVAIAQKPGIHL